MTSEATTCTAADGPTLARCMQQIRTYHRLVFTGDVQCTSAEACCPNGRALIVLGSNDGLLIEGGGHHILRRAGQSDCSALAMTHASNVTVQNLTFDEDRASPPCELKDKTCAATISIAASNAIRFANVTVLEGKGYVVKAWGVRGFIFEHSSIVNAGIIGLYIGHYKYEPSWDVVIRGSSFLHSRANGIALDGVYASSLTSPNVVSGNIFIDNHWHGLWPVGNIPGGITPGGQLLVANGRNITVQGNSFSGHPCGNCRPSNNVSAIEVGSDGPPPAGVAGLEVDCNVFAMSGQKGTAIRYNPGTIFSDGSFTNNSLFGYAGLDDVPSAIKPRILLREMLPARLDRQPSASEVPRCLAQK